MIIQTDEVGDKRRTDIGDLQISDTQIIQYRRAGKLFVRYLYDGLLAQLAEDMRDNLRGGYDNVAVVEGPEGSGKSNLAYQLCLAVDPTFDLNEQYVYSFDDLRDKLRAGDDHGSVYWLDEASNVANNREWQSQDNRSMISLLEMMRSRGWTLVMCIPHHERLDVYIRDYRIRYLIRCEPMTFAAAGHRDRGFFEVRKRNPYGTMRLIGYGEYDPIPDGPKKTYEQLKLSSQTKKIAAVTSDDKPGARFKKMYEGERLKLQDVALRLHEMGMDDKHLMDILGVDNYSTLHNLYYRARKRRESSTDGED